MATWSIGAVQATGATDIGAVQSALPAVPTGMPMLLKGQLISGALLSGRLIAMCLLIILLMEG